jgi:hypothetical protein
LAERKGGGRRAAGDSDLGLRVARFDWERKGERNAVSFSAIAGEKDGTVLDLFQKSWRRKKTNLDRCGRRDAN